MHRARIARHGDPNVVLTKAGQYQRGLSTEERFWVKVQKSDGCWIWTGARTGRTGHGRFFPAPGQPILAHRYAYELLVGPIPEGKEIDHLCRIRLCVNPAHMETVTHRVNVLRGDAPAAYYAKRTCCNRCGGPLRPTTVHRGKRSGRPIRVVHVRYCPACNRNWPRS